MTNSPGIGRPGVRTETHITKKEAQQARQTTELKAMDEFGRRPDSGACHDTVLGSRVDFIQSATICMHLRTKLIGIVS